MKNYFSYLLPVVFSMLVVIAPPRAMALATLSYFETDETFVWIFTADAGIFTTSPISKGSLWNSTAANSKSQDGKDSFISVTSVHTSIPAGHPHDTLPSTQYLATVPLIDLVFITPSVDPNVGRVFVPIDRGSFNKKLLHPAHHWDSFFLSYSFTREDNQLAAPVQFRLIGQHSVPEPSTWALMLVGVGGLGLVMRDRRRRCATGAPVLGRPA